MYDRERIELFVRAQQIPSRNELRSVLQLMMMDIVQYKVSKGRMWDGGGRGCRDCVLRLSYVKKADLGRMYLHTLALRTRGGPSLTWSQQWSRRRLSLVGLR